MDALPTVQVSGALFVAIATSILSLIASFVPGVDVWWAKLTGTQKRLGLLIAITAVDVATGVLTWTHVWLLIPAGNLGIIWLVIYWFEALIASQSAYSASGVSAAAKQAKFETVFDSGMKLATASGEAVGKAGVGAGDVGGPVPVINTTPDGKPK